MFAITVFQNLFQYFQYNRFSAYQIKICYLKEKERLFGNT